MTKTQTVEQPKLAGIVERPVCKAEKQDRDGYHVCTLLAPHDGKHRSGLLGKEWG